MPILGFQGVIGEGPQILGHNYKIE